MTSAGQRVEHVVSVMRRFVVRWMAIPLTSLTLKAWGRCWISTETAYRLNMLWASVALWRFREGGK